MPSLPTGTVTFLLTDIEGSTILVQSLGDRRYSEILDDHRRILRAAFAEWNGQEAGTRGDAFLVVFHRATDAVTCAVAAQRALLGHRWREGTSLRVRMAVHTGEPLNEAGDYVGLDVNRVTRICAAGHGSQILLSHATAGLAAHNLPQGISLRDLGGYHLKGLPDPERLFQVVHPDLPSDFPPLRSLEVFLNNLPRQLTSFVGRNREMADLKRLLSTARLITLTGAGGAGKTRLALQVASDVVDNYPDGVWFVELAPLSDPALVPKAIASALDVPENPGRQLHETLAAYLRAKHVLVVLDNCEHVLPGCRNVVGGLLRVCPKFQVLATSRQALGAEGELIYRVPSLQLPDLERLPPPEELVEFEAIRLFAERAAFREPGFAVTVSNGQTIAEICHRLDGIPLALEFAAARTKVLSLDQIAARLDDRFRLLTVGSRNSLPQHHTLRATMDWSYGLLSEEERAVFRRLSVFAGGWTLEAAEAICSGHAVEASRVLDLLAQLVDKSLVSVEALGGAARYRLLETVRQYARDRLLESGEDANARRRHRDWYLALAEEGYPEMFGPRQQLWLKRLETEHDNLRAALEWSNTQKDGAEAELRIAGALFWFWFRHADWSEARARLEAALARSAEAPPAVLPRALTGATQFAWRRGDFALARALGEEALALSRRLGDGEGTAWLLCHLGIVATLQGDYERATPLFDECANRARELGNRWLYGMTLLQIGIMARFQGDYEKASTFHTQSLTLLREAGDQWGIAYALLRQGVVALNRGDYGRSAASLTESLALCREVGDRWVSEECLEGWARIASAQGRYEKAVRLFGAAEELRETLGWKRAPIDQADHDRRAAATRSALGEAAFTVAWAEGRAMTLEQAIEYALAEEH